MEAALFGKRSIDAETVKFDVYCGSEFHEYLENIKQTSFVCVTWRLPWKTASCIITWIQLHWVDLVYRLGKKSPESLDAK